MLDLKAARLPLGSLFLCLASLYYYYIQMVIYSEVSPNETFVANFIKTLHLFTLA